MGLTDLDWTSIAGAAVFFSISFGLAIYAIVLGCRIGSRRLKRWSKNGGTGREMGALFAATVVYAIGAALLGATYLIASDWSGGLGLVTHLAPSNSARQTVVWAWALGGTAAYWLWNYSIMLYLGVGWAIDMMALTLLILTGFATITAAALFPRGELAVGIVGGVLLVVYAFMIAFWRNIPLEHVAFRIFVFLAWALKIGALLSSRAVFATLRSLASDGVLNLVADIALWGVFMPITLVNMNPSTGKAGRSD